MCSEASGPHSPVRLRVGISGFPQIRCVNLKSSRKHWLPTKKVFCAPIGNCILESLDLSSNLCFQTIIYVSSSIQVLSPKWNLFIAYNIYHHCPTKHNNLIKHSGRLAADCCQPLQSGVNRDQVLQPDEKGFTDRARSTARPTAKIGSAPIGWFRLVQTL